MLVKTTTKMIIKFPNFSNLDVRDGKADQQIHEDDADEHHKEQDHEVAREGVQRGAVLVDKVLVLNLPGHHDEGLHHRGHGGHVEALVVGEEDGEAERKGDEEAKVRGKKAEEVARDGGEHLDVDAEGGQAAHHEHEFAPDEKDADGGGMVLPSAYQFLVARECMPSA
jgi:hypothetical protein